MAHLIPLSRFAFLAVACSALACDEDCDRLCYEEYDDCAAEYGTDECAAERDRCVATCAQERPEMEED